MNGRTVTSLVDVLIEVHHPDTGVVEESVSGGLHADRGHRKSWHAQVVFPESRTRSRDWLGELPLGLWGTTLHPDSLARLYDLQALLRYFGRSHTSQHDPTVNAQWTRFEEHVLSVMRDDSEHDRLGVILRWAHESLGVRSLNV